MQGQPNTEDPFTLIAKQLTSNKEHSLFAAMPRGILKPISPFPDRRGPTVS